MSRLVEIIHIVTAQWCVIVNSRKWRKDYLMLFEEERRGKVGKGWMLSEKGKRPMGKYLS